METIFALHDELDCVAGSLQRPKVLKICRMEGYSELLHYLGRWQGTLSTLN